MIENFAFLFYYLKKEKINIDQKEFNYQIQSHPDYPSLLAIRDTLTFFRINNLATRIEKTDIIHLPNNFVALIKDKKTGSSLAFIERTKNGFQYTQKEKCINIDDKTFHELFENIVLLAEREENEVKFKNNQKSLIFVLAVLGLIYLISVFTTGFSLPPFLFVCFSSIGVYLSLEAIYHEFGVKTKFSEAVCTITTNADCNAVMNSKKNEFSEIISFSDSSIAFFGSQLLALLFLTISNQIANFYNITTLLLLFSVPVTLFSIYQQLFVTKKWCPICIAIIILIYAELLGLLLYNNFNLSINILSIIHYAFAITGSYLLTVFIKKIVKTNFEMQSKLTKNNRFKRKYSLFKMALAASDKVNNKAITSGNILLGNPEAKLKIIMISSPFCNHCKTAHNIIDEILENYRDKVSIDIRFNFNSEFSDGNSRILHQRLVRLYFEKGQNTFVKALHSWFKNKEIDKLEGIEISQYNDLKINEILYDQFLWNQDNKITFTPAIIINGYHFPEQYDRSDLIHFINDLEEDEKF